MNITAFYKGDFRALAVMGDGDAIVWQHGAGHGLQRLSHASVNVKWETPLDGIAMGDPVWRADLNEVVIPVYVEEFGIYSGHVAVERFRDSDGALKGKNELAIIHYGYLNVPYIPPAVLSRDGTLMYFAFQPMGNGNVAYRAVMACCDAAAVVQRHRAELGDRPARGRRDSRLSPSPTTRRWR